MPDPRLNKVLRDLWLNKSRSLLVALSIAVGVCAVGVIFGTRAIITRELQQSYLASQPPSAVLGLPPFEDDLVRALERGPDVRVAEGRRLLTVRVQVSPTTWKPLVLQAIPDFTAMRTAIVTRERGAWPPPKRTLSLERASQSLLGASVGDRLTIELPNGDRRTLAISGLAHDVTQPSALFTGQAHGYVTFDTLAALGQPRTYDRLNLIVAHDPLDKAHIQAVVESLKKRLERSGITVYWSDVPNPGEHPANSVLQPLMLLLGVLGGLSLFLSGLLVANMLAALLTQQVKQIGVMKAVGARTGQLAGMYFAAVTLFGLVALAIAAPLGDLGAIAFSRFIAGLLNTDLKSLAIPAGVWAAEGLVALIVPLGAALVPVLRGSRISVREAIQSHGAAGGHPSGAIDRLLQRVRGVSRPLLLSLRNTFRRKGRLALTLITLTLAGAIFVGVLSVNASLHKTLDQALAYWKYDIEVDFAHPERLESIQAVARELPDVTAVESWAFAGARLMNADGVNSDSLTLVGPPARTELLQPILLAGRWLLPGDESAVVINTEVRKQRPELNVGDQVTLKLNGDEHTFTVVGLVQGVLTGRMGYVNYPYLARLTGQVGRAGQAEIALREHGAAFQERLAHALEQRYQQAGIRVSRTQATEGIRGAVTSQFNILVAVLLVMAVILAVVGGLGLAGTMSVNVLERTREIGVMRAIGASNRAVRRIFIVEGTLIGLVSAVLATALAWPFSLLLSRVVGVAFLDAPLSFAFSVGGIGLWFGLAALLSAAASFWPAYNASRLTVRDVLAYE